MDKPLTLKQLREQAAQFRVREYVIHMDGTVDPEPHTVKSYMNESVMRSSSAGWIRVAHWTNYGTGQPLFDIRVDRKTATGAWEEDKGYIW